MGPNVHRKHCENLQGARNRFFIRSVILGILQQRVYEGWHALVTSACALRSVPLPCWLRRSPCLIKALHTRASSHPSPRIVCPGTSTCSAADIKTGNDPNRHGRTKVYFAFTHGSFSPKATLSVFLCALEVSQLHREPLCKAPMLCSAELDQIDPKSPSDRCVTHLSIQNLPASCVSFRTACLKQERCSLKHCENALL